MREDRGESERSGESCMLLFLLLGLRMNLSRLMALASKTGTVNSSSGNGAGGGGRGKSSLNVPQGMNLHHCYKCPQGALECPLEITKN